MKKFKLTKEHLALLSQMFITWNGDENGAPQIETKRPYGNSFIPQDIADILKWKCKNGINEKQYERAHALHKETAVALQIVLTTKKFKPGTYILTDEYDLRSWKLKK